LKGSYFKVVGIPTIVTTAHQKASGMDLKKELSLPASAKYTADEKRTTPGSKT
jgi:hypothetical protein